MEGRFIKWFKHDTSALHDAKIEKLIMKYGIQGYGLYFACVEIIAGNITNENITFELEHDAEILAYKFKIDTLLVEEMMKYICNLGLFETKDNRIYCYKLASRLDSSLIKNAALLKIKQRIQEDSRNIKKLQDKSSQNRLDKTRLDKKKYREYVFLTEDEYKKLLNDYGKVQLDTIFDKLDNYKGAKGKKYKSDYRAILSWVIESVKAEPLKKDYILCPSCGNKIIGTISYCGKCGLEKTDFKDAEKIKEAKEYIKG